MNQETSSPTVPGIKPEAAGAEDVKRFTVDLPTNLHVALKMRAATLRLSMREYVITIIEAALNEKTDKE